MKQVALLITYTMLDPIVGGAFFRALRLAFELYRRGWDPIICNHGPMLTDPKITWAADKIRFIRLNKSLPGFDPTMACQQFQALGPDVVIMGEGPFEEMQVFYDGARKLGRPFVMLDQYYHPWLLPSKESADLILLYGLKSFWGHDVSITYPHVMIPPFIDQVMPQDQLPVPVELLRSPWIVLVAYERNILQRGVKLLGGMDLRNIGVIVVSPEPALAGEWMAQAGKDTCLVASLPLQEDQVVFGLIQGSQVSLVSNGFIQVMDSLALACPVIGLKRSNDVGMNALNYDERFFPYISFEEDQATQRRKIARWLERSPFPQSLRKALEKERNGASVCADWIEKIAQQPR